MKAIDALRPSSRTVPSGLTSECCSGRSVPPVTTTEIRGQARSSTRATVRPLVTTVTSRRSARATSARAIAVVVVPTSSRTVSPSATSAAAQPPMAAFSLARSCSATSKGCSERWMPGGMAPPRIRRTRPWDSSDCRSVRTVTVETPKRAEQVADAHEALLLDEGGDALLAHLGGLRARGTPGHGPHASGVRRPGPPAR